MDKQNPPTTGMESQPPPAPPPSYSVSVGHQPGQSNVQMPMSVPVHSMPMPPTMYYSNPVAPQSMHNQTFVSTSQPIYSVPVYAAAPPFGQKGFRILFTIMFSSIAFIMIGVLLYYMIILLML